MFLASDNCFQPISRVYRVMSIPSELFLLHGRMYAIQILYLT